jgi:putative Ig domain-containing protein
MTTDGLISGTPQLGGTYEPLIAIKSQCGNSESLLNYYVVDPAPLRIRMGGFYSAVKGSSYSYRLLSTEGGVMTWTLDAGRLPAGLRLRNDGWILGRPTVTGSFLFRVKADDGRRTATETFPLDVVTRLALTTRTKLPAASVDRHFRVRLGVHGGVAPYRWQMLHGSPPRGVRFGYGVFAGTPRVAGTFRITVRVWDAQSAASTRTFTLVVRR